MSAFPIRTAALTVAAAIGLSACMGPYGYGGVGVGSGYGYGGYGYPSYGYGGGYSGYGYEPYWGWYDGYYYPGSGYYVYDRYRRPIPWDRYRDYWEGRRENAMSSSEFRRQMEARRDQIDRQNWSGFEQGPASAQRVRSNDSRSQRIERANRSQRVERSSNRGERSRSGRQSAEEFRRSMENQNNN